MVGYLSWDVAMRRELLGITYFPHGVLIAVGFVVGWFLLRHFSHR